MKQLLKSVAVFCILPALVLFTGADKYQSKPNNKTNLTLKERALREGKMLIVKDTSYHHGAYDNVGALSQDSATILIGTALDNECRLSDDGLTVNTIYQVRVDEVLKGDVEAGSIISVLAPGGLKVFDRAVSAVVQIPDYRQIRNSSSYAFFLGLDQGSSVFRMTGDFQGAFELPTDGSVVKASDRRTERLSSGNIRGRHVNSFLADVRSSTTKH